MADLAGFPYVAVEFDKSGAASDPGQGRSLTMAAAAADDLVVLAHGWNNNMADAGALYAALAGNLAPILGRWAPGRKVAMGGVLWPSMKFTEEDLIPGRGARAPGTAASATGPALEGEALRRRLEDLKAVFDGDGTALEEAKGFVDRLEDSPKARRDFVDRIRSVLPRPSDPLDDASDRFFAKPGDVLLEALKLPPAPTAPVQPGGPPDGTGGHAVGLGDVFADMKAAAWRLLNYTTYYQMKERAGAVGHSLNHVLSEVRKVAPGLRIHLVGHSFGARMVTAAVDGPVPFTPSSLALLQGAFSHNGFASRFDGMNDGFFRRVLGNAKVQGPIIATHTVNDQAVGTAYPLASRLAGDRRLRLGDENDPFGGIGRNGAIKLAAAEVQASKLGSTDAAYRFEAGKITNLLADEFIGNHGDVTNPAVANAVAHAILGT